MDRQVEHVFQYYQYEVVVSGIKDRNEYTHSMLKNTNNKNNKHLKTKKKHYPQ